MNRDYMQIFKRLGESIKDTLNHVDPGVYSDTIEEIDQMLKQLAVVDKLDRQEIWLKAWRAYTSSSNSADKERAATWADACLKAFDERFKDE